MSLERLSRAASFGGAQEVWRHASRATGCDMTFAIYLPPAANDGPLTAASATLNDPIPPGASYVASSAQVAGGGALVANGSAVHWSGTLTAGQSVTVTFAVRLPASAAFEFGGPHGNRGAIDPQIKGGGTGRVVEPAEAECR